MNPRSSRFLGIVRFLSLLSLAVWIGGLAMIGLAAPAIFKLNRLLIYGFNAPPLAALFSGCEFVLK